MSGSRGRPLGFKLSEESKDKIRESRTGQEHAVQTKRKISKSLKRYFRTPQGRYARMETGNRMSEIMINKWEKYSETDSYIEHKNQMKEIWQTMLKDMHKFTKEN
jgi:hypothetical protein